MQKLLFQNPVFEIGGPNNVSVRKGDKWAVNFGHQVVGQAFDIVETGKEDVVIHTARLVGLMVIDMNLIDQKDLNLEHDPSCRTKDGLLSEMRKVYGEDQIAEDEMVTVLEFEIVS